MHKKYILRCLELAKKGLGKAAPNPMVGAVLVYKNRIIGEGFHEVCGEAHAEVNCINSVKENDKQFIPKSTIYVSLEPCAHFGKTPPCANLIVDNKIPRVVIACKDPFAKVNGQGIAILEKAGIRVIMASEPLQKEALFLIRRFTTFHTKKRPYIILKWAESADGFIGKPDEQVWISNNICKKLSHKWRSEEAAILVGENTVLTDNPSLTVREWTGRNPVRIAFQKYTEFKIDLNIFDDSAKTILFSSLKKQQIPTQHQKVNIAPETSDFIPNLMNYLFKENINSLIVEGGKQILQAFINQNLWDEARVFKGNKTITSGIEASILHKAISEKSILGDNELAVYFNSTSKE